MKKTKILSKKDTSKMTRIDYIIAATITTIYAILSFINLGSMNNPQTFNYLDENETLIIEFKEETDVIRTKFFSGDLAGEFAVYGSKDNNDYDYITTIKSNGAFAWNEERIPSKVKYLKILSITESSLGEIAFYNNKKEYIAINKIKLDNKSTTNLTDEKKLIPKQISYMNSTYFDEIYFARTAYNYKEKIEAYEWTHPPLGKMIQAIPVLLFDKLTPFLYRLMGNISGIIMIYAIYILSKLLFKSTKWATVSSILLFFETLHFSQTRMGTVDGFLVLFIILSIYFMLRHVIIKNGKYDLALSGIFFALSISVKWTGFLGGLALAIIYFYDHFKNKKKLSKTILKGTIFFVVIPLIIYISIYLIYPKNTINYTNSLSSIIKQTEQMHQYHSKLEDSHFFSSKWYTWPISYKPVWYYTEKMSNSKHSSITGVGNIVILWVVLIAIPFMIIRLIKRKDEMSLYILICILSLWLPYIFIGRVMFMYHYFPVIPFIILAVTYLLKTIEEKTKKKIILPIYICLVITFFIVYYPVISGLPMNNNYFNYVKLFSNWYF